MYSHAHFYLLIDPFVWWFLGVADHQMTSPLACYQPLQILISANECKISVGLSVPTNSLTNFDLIKQEFN